MAEMIPDRLPSGASAGERKVFALLQRLPDQVIVYYEPVVADRYPDFIVIIPAVGLLVIEAKGWYPNHILSANNVDVTISSQGRNEVHKHPIRQARDYQFQLMDIARQHPETATLLQSEGAHAGRFIFPFGHLAVLNNCTRQQLEERGLSEVFPVTKVLARDELEALSPSEIVDRLRNYFDPWWPFGQLSDRQISVLRSIIHPEIVISPPCDTDSASKPTPRPLKVLDLRQERNAHSLGEGHRIVYGVAGSGKTVLLMARARLIAQDSNKQILILCYNRALTEYLQEAFSQTANVTCLNFHQWASQCNGVQFDKNEDEEAFGERLLQRLQRNEGDAHHYDAVFIDEAQDFSKNWFLCAKLALKDPDDGDLLIVGDGTQSLYRRRRFTWREAGVNAQGRTINTRFDLDKNYRNTREIMKVAAEFVSTDSGANDPESGLQIIKPDPEIAMRSGPTPEMLAATTIKDELRIALDKIRSWLETGLAPSDIAVLYRANANNWVQELASLISQHALVYWPHDKEKRFEHRSGVCIRTMHSAKGLQWRAVLVMRSDMMPFIIDQAIDRAEQERFERGLMYVAMTRAEDLLAFTRSTSTGFASRIEQLLN
jgi:superfamily I DNA/RNA helicase